MGIKSLNKFLAQHLTNSNCVRTIPVASLKDKVLAIDASIYLYKFICAIKNTCTDIYSPDGQVTTHIQAILTKLFSLLKRKIKPIFIFDGKPPDAKKEIMAVRTEKKTAAKNQIEEIRKRIHELGIILKTQPETAEEVEQYKNLFAEFMDARTRLKKILKQSAGFTTCQSDQCKQLLDLIGIPYVNSLQEADAQCAHLVKSGVAYAVVSEDMDILTFGSHHLITGLSAKDTCKIYDLNLILEDLNITYDQFIDICILLGCDYTTTIGGLGIKKILQQIRDYGNIEGIIASEQFTIPEEFDFQHARTIFKESEVIDNPNISWRIPNHAGIKDFLQINYSYTDDEIGRISDVLRGGYYSTISGEKNTPEYQKYRTNFRRKQMEKLSLDSDED